TLYQWSALIDDIRLGKQPLGPLVLPPLPKHEPKGKGKGKRTGRGSDALEAKGVPHPAVTPENLADASRWPNGPIVGDDQILARELETLVEAVLKDGEIMRHPSQAGLSRTRLTVAGRSLGMESARLGRFVLPLLVWFAKADLIAPATGKGGPWAGPRELCVTEKDAIRQRLLVTALPTAEEIAEARAAGVSISAM
ncbi:MAG: hypothetical protein WCG26_05315, partial [Chloroflexales bacterium]